MTHAARNAATALAAVLMLTLAACGSQTTAPDAPSRTANITFKADPVAELWVDGEHRGSTPTVLAIDPGAHEVAFKAQGFKDENGTIQVEAGRDLTIEAGLEIAGSSLEDYKRLLAALDVEHEDFGEIQVHRGAGDAPVMLYWPQRDVRKGALTTYRLEVTPDYEDDGWIEFRKGKDVLHRERFHAEDLITERALPIAVIEALKDKGTYTWGVYFDSKRKKPVTAQFKVVDGRKIDRRLAKLARRSTFQRANALMREMARIDVLRNSRLYSESLQAALSVLNTWPKTEMPFKTIAFSLERLKLKETTLYQDVASSLRGNGPSPRRPGLQDTNRDGASGGQTSGLPPSMVAPRVRERSGGLKAGGMGVTPTPEAHKRKPGPIEPGTESADSAGTGQAADGSRSSAASRERDPRASMEERLAAEESVDGAEKVLRETAEQHGVAQGAADAANAALEEARAAREALESSGSATEEQMEAARTREEDAAEAARAASEAAQATARQLDKASQALDAARRQLEDASGAGRPGETGSRLGTDALRRIGEAEEAVEASTRRHEEAQSASTQAREALEAAQAALQALETSGTATPEELGAARASAERAVDAVRDAEEAAAETAREMDAARSRAQKVMQELGVPSQPEADLVRLAAQAETALSASAQRHEQAEAAGISAREAQEAAEAAFRTLMDSGTATPAQLDEARASADAAAEAVREADRALESAALEMASARDEAQAVLDKMGALEKSGQDAANGSSAAPRESTAALHGGLLKHQRIALEEMQGALKEAHQLAGAADAALEAARASVDEGDPELRDRAESARQTLEALEGSGTASTEQLQNARTVLDHALEALEEANAEAERALSGAQAEAARADMEVERLRGKMRRAESELRRSEERLKLARSTRR